MIIWEKGGRITNPRPDSLDSFTINKRQWRSDKSVFVGHRNAIVFNSYHAEAERDLVLKFLNDIESKLHPTT